LIFLVQLSPCLFVAVQLVFSPRLNVFLLVVSSLLLAVGLQVAFLFGGFLPPVEFLLQFLLA
ncbi:hypothetical protein AAUPMC_00680, partial [Pasteurella multocida subsp. multocida str. Anand1_cattle]